VSQVRAEIARLPPGFDALARFVTPWGIAESPVERLRLRQQSTPESLQALYAAAAPMLTAIFEHLDRFPVEAELPIPQLTLYRIALGLIEAGQFVEVYQGKRYPTTFHSTEPLEGYSFDFTS
jgi:hypothetical protein